MAGRRRADDRALLAVAGSGPGRPVHGSPRDGAGAGGVRRKGEGNHGRARPPRRPRPRLGRRCPRDDPRVVRPRGHPPSRRRRCGWADRRGGGCGGRAGPGADRARRRALVHGPDRRRPDPNARPGRRIRRSGRPDAAHGGRRTGGGGGGARHLRGLRRGAAPIRVRPAVVRRHASDARGDAAPGLHGRRAPRSGARHRHDRGLSGSWRRRRVVRRSTSRSTPSRCTAGTATSTSTPWPSCCATLSASARAHPADRACRASPRSDSDRSDEEAHTRPARSS